MASSIYVFSNGNEYTRLYGREIYDKSFCTEITDVHISDKDQLILTCKLIETPDKPPMLRSFVMILDGKPYSHFLDDREYRQITTLHPLWYNFKRNTLEVKPHKWKFWKKAEWLNWHVDRYIGNAPKMGWFQRIFNPRKDIFFKAYYDSVRNRVCFILEEYPNHQIERSTPYHVSSSF